MARIIYFKNEDFREKGLKSLVGDKISNYIKIYKLEERFKGKYLPDYPSLFLESIDEEKYHIIVTRSLARLIHDPYPDHKVIGTMLIFGEDIIKNNANLYDVTPTLLSLVGLPIPKEADSDGVVNKKGEFPYSIAIKMKSLMKS
jgi:predicted AlkP superfamily phosphohydrolase/phosphomutase